MEPKLRPVEITCTSTDCGNNLHCFRRTREMARWNERGRCRSCGAELIDWDRVHKRDLGDVHHTLESLKLELIRHHFWYHVEIPVKATNYARRKGKRKLRDATLNRLRKAVGVAQPFRDGTQTPREGSDNPIYYAQHATGCCCRKCIEEWHGIPLGRSLTEEELGYLTELSMLYMLERIPGITEEGEKIPSLRKLRRNLGPTLTKSGSN